MSAKVILTITEGKLPGRQYIFDSRTSCIIGRAKDCNIKLPNDKDHSTISRYHCLLDINPPDIRIRDFGSRNGTYVNNKKIGQRQNNQTPEEAAKEIFPEFDLQDNDKIKLSNEFTVADVAVGSMLNYIPMMLKLDLSEYPNVTNYMKKLSERRAFQKAMGSRG